MSSRTIKKKARLLEIKSDSQEKLFHLINYTIFLLFALVCFYPFYFLFISTFSRNDFVELGKIIFYPIGIHFQNYLNMLKIKRLGGAAMISLLRTISGSLICLFGSSYLAYLFTKQTMWCRKLLYRLTIATMYFSAGLIPTYLNIKMLGLMNTFWVYIIPGVISVYNMILIKTFIESLPASLEESAEIDGAGYVRRYFYLIMPLSVPILATVLLFSVVGHWNAFMDTLLYVSDYRLFSLQYLLYEYYNNAASVAASVTAQIDQSLLDQATKVSETALKYTITMVTIIPVICVYPFVQRFYVKGMIIGAVKG